MKLRVLVEQELNLRELPFDEWPADVQEEANSLAIMYMRKRQRDLFPRDLLIAKIEQRRGALQTGSIEDWL